MEEIQDAGRLLASGERVDAVMLLMACAHTCAKDDTVPIPFLLLGSDLLASPEQVEGVRADGILTLCSAQSLISQS